MWWKKCWSHELEKLFFIYENIEESIGKLWADRNSNIEVILWK